MRTRELQSILGARWRVVAGLCAGTLVVACGGGGGGSGGPAGNTVGGSIAALTSAGLVLENQRGDRLTVASGATSFEFDTLLAAGAAYTVRVATHPATQDCTVANGSGTMGSSDVTTVAVTCAAMAPLALLSATPAHQAQDVPRNVRPRLEFSRPIEPGTVNTGVAVIESVFLRPSEVVPAVVTQQDGVLTLAPNRLLPLTRHLLVTTSALRGARGEALPPQISHRFDTADGVWTSSADTLGNSGREGDSGATVAIDDLGNAIAVWREGAAESARLMARRFDAVANQWQAPLELAAAVGDTSAPRLAMDSFGDAVVAWHAADAGATPMTRRFSRQAGQWEAVQALPVAAGVGSADLQLAVSRGGAAFLAWRTSDERVWLANGRLRQALVWQTPVAMDEGAANVRQSGLSLAVAEGGTGQALVVWGQRPAGGADIAVKARMYSVGGNPSLEPAVATLSTPGSLRAPMAVAAFDATNQAHVVWLYETAEGSARFTDILRRSRTVSQSTWQAPVTVATAPSVALPRPQVGLAVPGLSSAADYSVWVHWAAYDPIADRHAVWGRKVPVDVGINPLASALTEGLELPQPPSHRLVVDRAGNGMLALPAPEAATGVKVKLWRYAAAADRWTPGLQGGLGTMANTTAGFGLAVNRSGTIHAWWDGAFANGSRPVQARRFD